jgi:hypothetical protein
VAFDLRAFLFDLQDKGDGVGQALFAGSGDTDLVVDGFT